MRLPAPLELDEKQVEAVNRMKNGCILNGGVGSGKSRTALLYYFFRNGGGFGEMFGCDDDCWLEPTEDGDEYIPMGDPPQDLYIITTAKKRDDREWEFEMAPFLMSTDPEKSLYVNTIVIDSWNNIKKYQDVTDAFFIFDEDRVTGKGAWVKAFLKIAKNNEWIILSATPGDTWSDYIPVFIANGFFKNRTEFNNDHVVFNPHVNYPMVEKYLGTGKLMRLRNSILIDLEYDKKTVAHHEDVIVEYDKKLYLDTMRTRWDPFKDEPIANAGGFCYCLRKVVNSDERRLVACLELMEDHPKAIIFYNFDYELEMLRNAGWGDGVQVAEWNGHNHDGIPKSERWVYLVNYSAGAEGWNTTETDTIIFFSQNYSYKIMAQSAGRIDRRNTPYTDLWYYHLKSKASIDLAIDRAVTRKKQFNEQKFYGR
ncbi:MAG: hypothetical protein LIP10_03625 [Clostridiales bacterium]|nr:hypothetical protein [Clostridiales bacterium]